MTSFTLETGADGIALLTFDSEGKSMNTLTLQGGKELIALIAQIKTDAAIKGVIVQSGKASGFCAGADLGDLEKVAGAEAFSTDLIADKKFAYEAVGAFSKKQRLALQRFGHSSLRRWMFCALATRSSYGS